jgi:hypothetical protein
MSKCFYCKKSGEEHEIGIKCRPKGGCFAAHEVGYYNICKCGGHMKFIGLYSNGDESKYGNLIPSSIMKHARVVDEYKSLFGEEPNTETKIYVNRDPKMVFIMTTVSFASETGIAVWECNNCCKTKYTHHD